MSFKQLKIRRLLLIFGMLAIVFASEAQNKKFKLVLNSSIKIMPDDEGLGQGEELAPIDIYEFEFEYNHNGLSITIPKLDYRVRMSNNLGYVEEVLSTGDLICILYDKNSSNGIKTFKYIKGKSCSPSRSDFSFLQLNLLETAGLGIIFNDETKEAINICQTTVKNDPLIKFMRSISDKKQTPENNNSSLESTLTPKYGEVELLGYAYEREWYDSRSYENAKGTLNIRTSQSNHYIEIKHGCRERRYSATNLVQKDKYRTNWSTRKGAIKISLPDGVAIGNNDEIICWEHNSDPNNPDDTNHPSREAVMFVYSPSTGKLQYVRTYECERGSDMYYFVTTDASAWSKIKPMLLYNLSFCGNRIN